MTYQIDFTASNYVGRSRRKTFLRILLLILAAGLIKGVHDVYTTYNESTLNMKLAAYEAVAYPIEEMNAAWDTAAAEYAAIIRYYRLFWAANPTNFLSAMTAPDAPRLGSGFRPVGWSLATGGECRLDYRYVFDAGDKAAQTKGLEDQLVRAVTSVVSVVDGRVDVQGVRHENLLDVESLSVSIGFSLPDARAFPTKERTLTDCVGEIAALRSRIQEAKLPKSGDGKGGLLTPQGIMMAYLPSQFGKDKETGRPRADFPDLKRVLNPSGWFKHADDFIAQNRIPGDDSERVRLRAIWDGVGEARFPWDRFRLLDNEELVNRTTALSAVSDGVKRFKGFLEKRQADNRKKLEPFIECYEHNDVFNKPLIESDLKDRVAAAAGIAGARVAFKDEGNVPPAVLVREDEKFNFTWIRWTLSVGGGTGHDGARQTAEEKAAEAAPLTLPMVADCVNRALTLGPGYVLETVKVGFAENGTVTGAVIEGLLPVKKVELLKEEGK